MPEASVILCVRNGAATIAAQLQALSAQDWLGEWETVIVDNGSTDATVDIIREWESRLPAVRLLTARERSSLAYARNRGAAAARGEVLAFCDADDVAAPGWLAALVAGARDAELVGGRLELASLNEDFARYWRGLSDEDLTRPSALGYLHYAVGANFAVRSDTYRAVGGCDEAFFVCSDDIDLSWRIQQSGGRLIFRPDAVMHYRLRTDLRGLFRQRLLYGEMEGLLRRKFGDSVAPVRVRDRWPTYRYLLTRGWHLAADANRRGGWVSAAGYCAGRFRGAIRYRVLQY